MVNTYEYKDCEGEYSNGADLLVNSGFYNAFIEIHGSIGVKEYEAMCNVIIKVGKEVSRFVNFIAFRRESIVLILDPMFDMNLVPQFKSGGDWSYNIDVLNLTKGYYRRISGYPTVHIVKPVIWTREAKA